MMNREQLLNSIHVLTQLVELLTTLVLGGWRLLMHNR